MVVIDGKTEYRRINTTLLKKTTVLDTKEKRVVIKEWLSRLFILLENFHSELIHPLDTVKSNHKTQSHRKPNFCALY